MDNTIDKIERWNQFRINKSKFVNEFIEIKRKQICRQQLYTQIVLQEIIFKIQSGLEIFHQRRKKRINRAFIAARLKFLLRKKFEKRQGLDGRHINHVRQGLTLLSLPLKLGATHRNASVLVRAFLLDRSSIFKVSSYAKKLETHVRWVVHKLQERKLRRVGQVKIL